MAGHRRLDRHFVADLWMSMAGRRENGAGAGVDMKVKQELLRHADVRTTMNVYTQPVSEQKRAVHSSVVRMVLA